MTSDNLLILIFRFLRGEFSAENEGMYNVPSKPAFIAPPPPFRR
jgi:hypothetical protein